MAINPHGKVETKHLFSPFWKNGWDIRIFGILLVVAGVFDLVWISAYPNYALKVFGTTFEGLTDNRAQKVLTNCMTKPEEGQKPRPFTS